jgi:hypothetical protein
MLDRPLTELRARQFARRPGATEGMTATVLRLTRCLQGREKIALIHHL